MKQIKKVINWYIGRVYKFNDPEYKKVWRTSYMSLLVVVIVGAIVMMIWRPTFNANQVWQVAFLISWLFIAGVLFGASAVIESADRYQARKKKDNLPTI